MLCVGSMCGNGPLQRRGHCSVGLTNWRSSLMKRKVIFNHHKWTEQSKYRGKKKENGSENESEDEIEREDEKGG
ncbi:unnamed protein product [Prunus armeniaca]